jgi:amino acid transporter
MGALVLNMIMTLILMLAPPPGNIYRFLIDLAGYPEWIFYGISVVGLLYLRFTEPNTPRPFKSYWIPNLIFIAVCIFLTVFPFVPPKNYQSLEIPYWLYPTIGVAWVLLCIPWWYVQVIVLKGPEKSINAQISMEEISKGNSEHVSDVIHSLSHQKIVDEESK